MLKPGDHIYTWRRGRFYAHHGIYVGDDEVIHFTSRDKSHRFSRPSSSSSSSSAVQNGNGVVSSSLDSFLDGGDLYCYEYSVSTARYFASLLGGTCTLADSDEADAVIHRARYLIHNGFVCYHLFTNNCENFAVYCKTELALPKNRTVGHCGQILNIKIVVNLLSSLFTRYAHDIGVRKDAVRVPVEELANFMSK